MRRRSRTERVDERVVTAARALYVDAFTVELVRALARAGVRSILLRGPTVAKHFYPAALRAYGDADLLVAPDAFAEAERLLALSGFEHRAVLGQRPDDRPVWARTWRRRADGAEIDLHRTLVGARASLEEVWGALDRHVEPIEVGGAAMDGLDAAATAVIVTLHAAHHGARFARPLEDLSRAIARLGESEWRAAASLAAELEATPSFAAGLRLLPEGVQLADSLELPTEASAEVILRASGAPPMALGFEWLAQTPGLRAKLRLIAGKTVPDAEFMRAWSPLARGGSRLGLAAAYAWRPIWLLLHAARGFRAWRRAARRSS